MKYIRLYKTHAEYLADLEAGKILIPSIHYSEDLECMSYHPYGDLIHVEESFLLLEDGDCMLFEDNTKIKLEL